MPVRQQTSRRRFLSSKQGILFLVFAAVIWTISALSDSYSATVPIRVELISDVDEFVLLSSSVEVPAQVSSTGFSIIYRRIFPKEIQLLVSQLPLTGVDKSQLSTQFIIESYRKTYSNSTDIQFFVLPTVKLPLAESTQKTFVPVLANQPQLAEGYLLTTPLKFSIDSVSAFGSKRTLEKLQNATFIVNQDNALQGDFTLQAEMTDSIAKLANWSVTAMEVSGTADRYSEVSFEIPVTIINNSTLNKISITIAPKQVEVRFAAPLSLIRSMNASELRAEVIYDKEDSNNQLPVRIYGLPSVTKQVSVTPATVSYYILE